MTAFPAFDVRGSVHVAGSTSIRAPAQLAAELFMAEQTGMVVTIAGGGTVRGIRSLINGTIDAAFASSDLTKEDLQAAAKLNITLARHVLGHDAVMPVVHPANPIKSLTLEELQSIYAGESANWRDFGGPDLPITVLTYDPLSGTAEFWYDIVLGHETLTPKAQIIEPVKILPTIAATPGAIGYISHTFLNNTVREMAVAGTIVSAAAIRNGQYALRRPFGMITAATPKPAVRAFLDFMLTADKGQRLLAEAGNVPLK